MKLIRYRNWHSPVDVRDDEADILRQVMALPESSEQTLKVSALFGSLKVFRRCWKAYAEWADPKLVAAAEGAYGRSVGAARPDSPR